VIRPWTVPIALGALALASGIALSLASRARRPAAPAPAGSGAARPAPTRIASTCAAASETVAALGLAPRLAAVDRQAAVPGAPDAVIVGSGGMLSSERIAAVAPDLAFVWWYENDAARAFERLGVPVVRLRASSVEEALGLVETVAEACGEAADGRALAGRLRAEIGEAGPAGGSAGADSPLVFLELHSPWKSCGPGSYGHDLVARAGGRNLAAGSAVPYPLVSAESVIAAQPDVILLVREDPGRADDFASRPGCGALKAVRGGRVHVVPNALVSPGPRAAEAVRTLRALFRR
jgi:iron complex transport system substrate-binding protein